MAYSGFDLNRFAQNTDNGLPKIADAVNNAVIQPVIDANNTLVNTDIDSVVFEWFKNLMAGKGEDAGQTTSNFGGTGLGTSTPTAAGQQVIDGYNKADVQFTQAVLDWFGSLEKAARTKHEPDGTTGGGFNVKNAKNNATKSSSGILGAMQKATAPKPTKKSIGRSDRKIGNAFSKQGPTMGTDSNYHKIQAGDTLSQIAKKYGTSIGALVALNNITDANKIFTGDVLQVD